MNIAGVKNFPELLNGYFLIEAIPNANFMTIEVSHHLTSPCQSLVIPVTGTSHLETCIAAFPDIFVECKTYIQHDFKGETGEIHQFYTPNHRIFLIGLGEKPQFGEILKAFRSFGIKYKSKIGKNLAVQMQVLPYTHSDISQWSEAAANGLMLATYQLGKYKTDNGDLHPLSNTDASILFLVASEHTDAASKATQRAAAFASTQLDIFDLVNAPANHKNPDNLGRWAKESGKKYGYRVQVLDKDAIVAQGMHALLAVNQGSAAPPAFIIMEYRGKGENLPRVTLVGKGVTFDTGGLSIKPSTNMHLMKSDMGGAAAVLGTLEMAARLQLPVHLTGLIPATDNSVDALSLKPGDIISSYSGKTIEVIDTDAEGRLILADGLAYAIKNYAPDILIDLATLTGSAVRTFGYHAAALFSSDDNLARKLSRAGDKTGERVWQLPIWDIYKEDIKSDIADVKNFSGKPAAGAISAAKFLEFFTDNHPSWAHLDIAGVAFSETDYSSGKSASGFGIRLLIEYLEDILNVKA